MFSFILTCEFVPQCINVIVLCHLRVLKAHTAYFNTEGILVTAPVMCATHYLKTNLLLDFLANCPTELLSLIIWNGGQDSDLSAVL